MVELKETSDILAGATERSFVVLDELGRGEHTELTLCLFLLTQTFAAS